LQTRTVIAQRGLLKSAQFQLGAENNIEKSRCLAQTKKNIFIAAVILTGFSVFPRPASAQFHRDELLRSL
jgi:hypothetical protein